MSRWMQMMAGIAISFALIACAVQGDEEPILPDSETALITTSDVGLWIGVGAPGTGMAHNLRLPPGYSCVDVSASQGSVVRGMDRIIGKFELCFEAGAGRTYEVRVLRGPAQPPKRRWKIQTALITDVESGEILDAQEAS